jgi:hypothetical protein
MREQNVPNIKCYTTCPLCYEDNDVYGMKFYDEVNCVCGHKFPLKEATWNIRV